MTEWGPYLGGETVGRKGPLGGLVLRDEALADEARITLEEGPAHAPFSVFCEIRGWLEHSVVAAGRAEARELFEAMKDALGSIVDTIPLATPEVSLKETGEQMEYVEQQLASFVTLFPAPNSSDPRSVDPQSGKELP